MTLLPVESMPQSVIKIKWNNLTPQLNISRWIDGGDLREDDGLGDNQTIRDYNLSPCNYVGCII